MRAVVLRGPNDVRLEDVSDPALLADTDAIVRVDTAAICGADLGPLHGHVPGFELGTILGHEFAGKVVEVGSAVTKVRPGERVVNMSLVADGTCPACRAGRVTQCSGRALFGYSGVYPRLDGAQAELVRVPHANTVLSALPDSVSDEDAVFLADNLPTAYDAVTRGEAKAGDLVCVVGLGAVGLMAVMVALDLGATVVAVDGVEQRRALAGLGAGARTGRGLGCDRSRHGGPRRRCRRRVGGVAGRARSRTRTGTRPRHGLGRRCPLRAGLPPRQRAHVHEGADDALVDRRLAWPPRAADLR
jgi:threonine dehydrogenase-like Zn-dependent dehydrogenase